MLYIALERESEYNFLNSHQEKSIVFYSQKCSFFASFGLNIHITNSVVTFYGLSTISIFFCENDDKVLYFVLPIQHSNCICAGDSFQVSRDSYLFKKSVTLRRTTRVRPESRKISCMKNPLYLVWNTPQVRVLLAESRTLVLFPCFGRCLILYICSFYLISNLFISPYSGPRGVWGEHFGTLRYVIVCLKNVSGLGVCRMWSRSSKMNIFLEVWKSPKNQFCVKTNV